MSSRIKRVLRYTTNMTTRKRVIHSRKQLVAALRDLNRNPKVDSIRITPR